MKKLLMVVSVVLFLFLPAVAHAHVLKTDGSIGVVIHVDPEDDPIAGEPGAFYFDFKDRENKFDPTNCNCIATISQNGKELFSQSFYDGTTKPSLSNASFSYTFPARGVYTLSLSGKPTGSAQFQPFSISDDVRVERVSSKVGKDDGNTATVSWIVGHQLHLIAAGIILAFFIFAVIKQKREK